MIYNIHSIGIVTGIDYRIFLSVLLSLNVCDPVLWLSLKQHFRIPVCVRSCGRWVFFPGPGTGSHMHIVIAEYH